MCLSNKHFFFHLSLYSKLNIWTHQGTSIVLFSVILLHNRSHYARHRLGERLERAERHRHYSSQIVNYFQNTRNMWLGWEVFSLSVPYVLFCWIEITMVINKENIWPDSSEKNRVAPGGIEKGYSGPCRWCRRSWIGYLVTLCWLSHLGCFSSTTTAF